MEHISKLPLVLNCFLLHSCFHAFLVTTELTPVSLALINGALAIVAARVVQVLSHRSLEESLKHSVVKTQGQIEFTRYFMSYLVFLRDFPDTQETKIKAEQ